MQTEITLDIIKAEAILKEAYQAFNNRNIDGALSNMHPDVCWPNGMEGGIEKGHAAVRSYWARQWQMINPHVEPVEFTMEEDGRVKAVVHQVVHDLSGNVLIDENVHHIYTIQYGFITKMEIEKL